ncbi:MAG: hypothetical protein DRG39_01265 [Deltaproteobacteria bacterium]|nr:MAG: hypothetical protein DRG39_01265 [Deltaproteobacteria bacterium]
MKNIFKSLINKKGAKNVLSILSGNSAGYLISICAIPVLTRLYNPEQIGHLSLFMSIILVLSVGICLKYELAIVLPKNKKDAMALLYASFFFAFIISIIIEIAVLFTGPYISLWINKPVIRSLMLFIPVGLFLNGIYQSLSYWTLRMKRFNYIGISWAIIIGFAVITQIFIGLTLKPSVLGLITGYISGLFAGSLFLLLWSLKKDTFYINWADLIKTAIVQVKKYKKYPLYSVWPSFLDNFTMTMPILFFTRFFDQAVVGLYSLGMKTLMAPVSVLGKPISQVYFQRVADELNSKNEVTTIVEDTFLALFFISLPILLIIPIAPQFFSTVFGDKWLETGYFVRILAPAMIFRFIASPMSVVFGALNKQEISAIWKVLAFFATAISLLLSIPFKDPMVTVIFLTINDIIIYNVYILMIFKVSKVRFYEMIKRVPQLWHNWL